MVMRGNCMRKNLTRTIRRSLGRFLAITAIIALGCSIFIGLRITKTDMIVTGQKYTDEQNMFDLRLLSSYGWNQDDVAKIAKMDGVAAAEGSVTVDVYATVGEITEEQVYRLYSLPEKINKVYILGGRLPTAADECLVDGSYFDASILGETLEITPANSQDTLDNLSRHTFTVVGYISTPLYMDMSRGSTTLGSGTLTSYVYLPTDAFLMDYYTEINITLPGDYDIYTPEFDDAMDNLAEKLEPLLQPLADERFAQLREDAEKAYADGYAEYENGVKEYEAAKADALAALEEGLKELEDAKAELEENQKKLEDGEAQLLDAQKLLDEEAEKLRQGKLELDKAKAETYAQMAAAEADLLENYKKLSAAQAELESGKAQLESGISQLEDGIVQIDDGLRQINDGLQQLDTMLPLLNSAIDTETLLLQQAKNNPLFTDEQIAQMEESLRELTARRAEYLAQKEEAEATKVQLEAQKAELEAQLTELKAKQKELLTAEAELKEGMNALTNGQKELEIGRAQAEYQFSAAQAQLDAGQVEIDNAQAQLDANKAELEEGKKALAEGEQKLSEGWAEYESGKIEAEAELAKAEQELADAKLELEDARREIDTMDNPQVFALTRNTNAGYLALDSNSDIVSGVATVLPVFFLLIAALVCITTMTRMVEEERTQIGTLKALGYSSFSIMGKYLLYSATASIIGCVLGILVGSTFFPTLLWNAYKIILNIVPNVEFVFDWEQYLPISIAYLLISSLVTWYCCHRTLREVPSELIRPRAPTTGKKIWLEHLFFWNKLSFLNKVMLRNVFRYRQRFLMMLIGIGGCTALLLTGFGMRDTIVDIANIQFSEVSLYDIEVTFSGDMTPEDQEIFRDELGDTAQSVGFFYQASTELSKDGQFRDVSLIVADSDVKDYIAFRRGQETLSMPGLGKAFLSVGMSELMGISVGDQVTVRTSDMKTLTVTVSGIFDNHVYNYLVVTPETVAEQWGESPVPKSAYVNIPEGGSVASAGSIISSRNDVLNMTVCEDMADMVNSMMDAMDLLVVVIVFCAGLLAAIVLYNLTNININERIREIATIKVLGFNAMETSSYVFKENILLTAFGMVFGLALGRVFLDFVMSKIKIDMVWFETRLAIPSYFYSIGLTLLCAFLVAVVFHRRLQKINMAEALKSVE